MSWEASEKRRAVVFGANGSLGLETVRQLSAKGIDTVAVVRPGKAVSVSGLDHVTPAEMSLTDWKAIDAVLHDASEVYYTPANFSQGRSRPGLPGEIVPGIGMREALRLNSDIPDEIYRLAEHNRVGRMVYVSSIAVYGAQKGEKTESSSLKGNGFYAVSKQQGEKALARKDPITPVTIVRPANVFGPGAALWSEELYQRFSKTGRKGRFIPGKGEGNMPPVDIRDVAKAMITAVEMPDAAGQTYNLAADETLSLKQIADYYQIITGTAPELTSAFLTLLVGQTLDVWSIVSGKPTKFALESARNLLDPTHRISNKKAKKDLGISFRPVEETMRDTLLWLNEKHGLGKEQVIYEAFQKRK